MLDLLERAGPDACRPEALPREYGFRERTYYLSAAQAQEILGLRLQKMTDLTPQKTRAEQHEPRTTNADTP